MDHNEPVWCMLNLVYATIVEQIGHVKTAVIFLFVGISLPNDVYIVFSPILIGCSLLNDQEFL